PPTRCCTTPQQRSGSPADLLLRRGESSPRQVLVSSALSSFSLRSRCFFRLGILFAHGVNSSRKSIGRNRARRSKRAAVPTDQRLRKLTACSRIFPRRRLLPTNAPPVLDSRHERNCCAWSVHR